MNKIMNKKEFAKYEKIITDYTAKSYLELLREPSGILTHKFLVPGAGYSQSLWDWDSWLTDLALNSIVKEDISEYEKGCVLNFLDNAKEDGSVSVFMNADSSRPKWLPQKETNIHKPILAQQTLFISEKENDFSWIKDYFPKLEKFIAYYETNCKHESGLFFWIDDFAIGVDNEPCTFYRPERSSASIYLNCLMYKELLALSVIAEKLEFKDKAEIYNKKAVELKNAINSYCWDDKDGFYYSVDINLLPINPTQVLHKGAPRHWNCLIQRICVWTGFMAMWAGIADEKQAERMVKENYLNPNLYYANYGVYTLAPVEKMYQVIHSNNPSCWLGPIWGISNYMTFDGLRKYGYKKLAKELALKTIKMLGMDIEKSGELHEYYSPQTGEAVSKVKFQSWNLFVAELIKWVKEN